MWEINSCFQSWQFRPTHHLLSHQSWRASHRSFFALLRRDSAVACHFLLKDKVQVVGIEVLLLDVAKLLVTEPGLSFAVLPNSKFSWLAGGSEHSVSLLLAVGPPPEVFFTIIPSVMTEAIFLVINKVSSIGFAIRERVESESMHKVVLEFSFVYSLINPFLDTNSVNSVIAPIAFVSGIAWPFIVAEPTFNSICI